MSIEALLGGASGKYKHSPGHDLESLLYTILTICHYTIGPGGQLREAKLEKKNIQLNKWFTTANRGDLANEKTVTLLSFDMYIKEGLSPYWNDFAPFLQELVNVTWDPTTRTLIGTPNIATHAAYRTILLKALAFYEKVETEPLAPYAVVPTGKRSRSQFQIQLPHSKRPRLMYEDLTLEEIILPRPSTSRTLKEYRNEFAD